MTITPITDKSPACLGVCCELHAACHRYALVERVGSAHAIGTCDDGNGKRPLFVQVEVEVREGVAA